MNKPSPDIFPAAAVEKWLVFAEEFRATYPLVAGQELRQAIEIIRALVKERDDATKALEDAAKAFDEQSEEYLERAERAEAQVARLEEALEEVTFDKIMPHARACAGDIGFDEFTARLVIHSACKRLRALIEKTTANDGPTGTN